MEYELYHYGVKGMKWGVRKFQEKSRELDAKKAAMKKAKKSYNKAFNKANNRAIGAYSPLAKHRKNAQKRWENAADKAERYEQAKKDYKAAKKEFRKNTTVGQKINRGSKTVAKILRVGASLAVADVISGGAYSSMAKSGTNYLKNKAMDKMFNASIIDATGKTIHRYNI